MVTVRRVPPTRMRELKYNSAGTPRWVTESPAVTQAVTISIHLKLMTTQIVRERNYGSHCSVICSR